MDAAREALDARLDSIEAKLDRVIAVLAPVHSHAEWVDDPYATARSWANEHHAANR